MNAEDLKNRYWPVLDKGFVALVDCMGNDETIERYARVSYGKGTRKSSDTRNLIRYLIRHHHSTPIEAVEFSFHLALPIHVAPQLVRHRTFSPINEYSTRYSEALDARQTIQPDEWRLQSKSNKQGSSGKLESWDDVPSGPEFSKIAAIMNCNTPGEYLSGREYEFHKDAINLYKERLAFGVAREQARKDLPLSTYTVAYWKIDLHNLFHFLKLRLDPHAQLEIRSYAMIMASMVKAIVPLAWEAFADYILNAKTFTHLDLELLHHQQTNPDPGMSWEKYAMGLGMSKREYEEYQDKLFPGELIIPDLDLSQAKPPEYFEEMIGNDIQA